MPVVPVESPSPQPAGGGLVTQHPGPHARSPSHRARSEAGGALRSLGNLVLYCIIMWESFVLMTLLTVSPSSRPLSGVMSGDHDQMLQQSELTIADRERLRPMVVDHGFVIRLRQEFNPLDPPVRRHLVGDFWVVYAAEYESHYVFLAESDLARVELSKYALHETALHHFRNSLPHEAELMEFGDGTSVLYTESDFGSAVLLLNSIWESWDPVGELVVAVPNSFVIEVADSGVPGSVETLMDSATVEYANSDRPISDQLLVRRGGRWRVYDRVPMLPYTTETRLPSDVAPLDWSPSSRPL